MAVTSSAIDLVDGDTAPSNPAAGSQTVYIRSGTTYKKDSSGTETPLVNGVSSVANSDGTLTISPTTGAVVASRAAITGDISVPITSNVATLPNVNANVGSFGTATQVATVTLNAKGQVTAGVNTAIQIAESQVTNLVTDLGNKQPLDADLTTIASLTPTTDSFLQSKASAWTTRTPTQVTADLIPATTSLQGVMSASDKSRADNWHNKAVYNVLDNGISASNSGAANVTAWNALMTLLANSTASIYFPPAATAYDFATVCAIPAGVHLRIMGGGPGTRTSETFGTIIRTTSATENIFSCGDWYQEFQDLHFRSSATRSAGSAILSGDNIAICVYRCNFHEMWNGITYSGGASSGNLSIVDNCGFTETKNFSIQIDGTNANTIIRGCVADGALGNADAHLEINACGSLLVSDCDFIRAVNNVRFNPDSGTKGVFSVYFTNTFFDTASGSSVKFQGGAAGTNIQRIKFVNCWFSGSVTGCEFAANSSTNKATGIDFVNCDIFSNSANGVLATEVQDFAMNNCRVAGNTTAGVSTVAASGSVTKFNIQNCTIGPTGGIGANGIGVSIAPGTYGSYNISGNNVAGNTSSNNIIDAGSVPTADLKIVEENLGHILKGAIASQGGTPLSIPVTTETLVLAGRIPANAVAVGQVFRLRAIVVTSAANVITWRVRVGANGTVADAGVPWTAVGGTGVANGRQSIDVLLTVRSATTVNAEGLAQSGTAAPTITFAQPTLGVATTTAIVSTAAWFMDITLSQTLGSCLVQQAVIESL